MEAEQKISDGEQYMKKGSGLWSYDQHIDLGDFHRKKNTYWWLEEVNISRLVFCAPAVLFRKRVFGEPSSRRVPLCISDVESITSCFSGSGWEGNGEGSGNGNALIVFIVRRNSPLTFKAKTNSCERWRHVADRSHEYVKSDMKPTPLRQVQTQMRSSSNMSNNVLLALQLFSHLCSYAHLHKLLIVPPTPRTDSCIFPPLVVVKTHTHMESHFPSTLAKIYQPQFIIYLFMIVTCAH